MPSIAQKVQAALDRNDYQKFKEADFSASQLLEFKPAEYRNVLLYAARHCSVEIVQEIIEIIRKSKSQGHKFKELLNSEDDFGRSIFCLAAIADNERLLRYLREQWRFKLDYPDKNKHSPLWHTIDRDNKKAFHYLIQAGACFGVEEEKCIAHQPQFKKYFNSPECLLKVVNAGRESVLNYLLHDVENQPPEVQKLFIEAWDSQERDALILAAMHHPFLVQRLTKKLKFNLEHRDRSNHTALWYLSEKGKSGLFGEVVDKAKRIDQKHASEIAEFSKTLAPSTPVAKKDMGRALTHSPSGVDQEGRMPKTHDKPVARPHRTFAVERERQLLRHSATQLHFAVNKHIKEMNKKIKKEDKDKKIKALTEIQMMHMDFNGRDNLFVAANGTQITASLAKFMVDTNLKTLLTTAHPTTGEENTARTRRFSNKLKQRVFGEALALAPAEHQKDREQAKEVGEILRSGDVEILEISLDKNDQFSQETQKNLRAALNNQPGKIYILVINCKTIGRNKDRHAEEYLTDIVEFAKKEAKPVYTCIAGKKRPCLGCSGRMQGVVDQYSDKPGLYWLHTMRFQHQKAASNTTNVLLTQFSHVSLSRDGKKELPDHDSGSDSECDVAVNHRVLATLRKAGN